LLCNDADSVSNGSYFLGCDIFKDNPSLAWAFDRGVSIWECYGIEFRDTHFDGIAAMEFSVEMQQLKLIPVVASGIAWMV